MISSAIHATKITARNRYPITTKTNGKATQYQMTKEMLKLSASLPCSRTAGSTSLRASQTTRGPMTLPRNGRTKLARAERWQSIGQVWSVAGLASVCGALGGAASVMGTSSGGRLRGNRTRGSAASLPDGTRPAGYRPDSGVTMTPEKRAEAAEGDLTE